MKAYGAKHKKESVRSNSSSGGVFYALASSVLTRGGAICGAAYTDDFAVEHQLIQNAADMIKLQGAKYAQSCTEHLFPQLQSILEADRWLLFVGTPCQVAGLRMFLGKEYDKLVLVDMICHGVPSPMIWRKYLDYRAKQDLEKAKIVSINQRDKGTGWSKYRYSIRIEYESGNSYSSRQSEDPYMMGFVNNLYLRPSCSQCQFKGSNRCSDSTLGDFWGVWEQHPQFDDDKGVSLVFINTEKGAQLWDDLQGDLVTMAVSCEEALLQNPSALYSAEPHPMRNEFFRRHDGADFEKLVSALLFGTSESKHFLRNLMRRIFKF
jgi:coenzyme F420-reducing hydrogenase beta subunit